MKGLLFIILCCIINAKCYVPEKTYNLIAVVRVIEIEKTELGWDIYWEDVKGNEYRTFTTDSLIYYKGYKMLTLIKQ